MKAIKKNVNREDLVNQKNTREERLNNGQSITKAIIMNGKACCGGAYVKEAVTYLYPKRVALLAALFPFRFCLGFLVQRQLFPHCDGGEVLSRYSRPGLRRLETQ